MTSKPNISPDAVQFTCFKSENKSNNLLRGVCVSVCRTLEFYRDGWMDQPGFWCMVYLPFTLHCALTQSGQARNQL